MEQADLLALTVRWFRVPQQLVTRAAWAEARF